MFPSVRISAVALRRKRDPQARRFPRPTTRAAKIAAPFALLATMAPVAVGVVSADVAPANFIADAASFTGGETRGPQVSRSQSRLVPSEAELARQKREAATAKAVKNADERLWTTATLEVWSSAAKSAKNHGEIDAGRKVLVTGRRDNGRAEIVLQREARWVNADYLSDEKPLPGISSASCSNGTSVPSGVSPNIVKVHRAVCAAFPEITTYGTFRGDGEHAQGIAVDIMVSGSRGWQVAEYVRAHYAELGVSYLIYSQKIWSVERGGEGWRGMSDRGSVTANHYDHVHVTTF